MSKSKEEQIASRLAALVGCDASRLEVSYVQRKCAYQLRILPGHKPLETQRIFAAWSVLTGRVATEGGQ